MYTLHPHSKITLYMYSMVTDNIIMSLPYYQYNSSFYCRLPGTCIVCVHVNVAHQHDTYETKYFEDTVIQNPQKVCGTGEH